MVEDEQPTDEQLIAAGFDLADDLDRPDRHCDCPKCKAFYVALDGVQEVDRGSPSPQSSSAAHGEGAQEDSNG